MNPTFRRTFAYILGKKGQPCQRRFLTIYLYRNCPQALSLGSFSADPEDG